MRVLFCDDQEDVLQTLQKYVAEFFRNLGGKTPEFASYTSGDALLQKEHRADIAFLDVEMPGTSGIHIGAKLKQYNPQIKIFIVTAYPDYLDEAMRFQVFRYLSKPIDKNRLLRNLKDAVYLYNMESKEYPVVTNSGIVLKRSEEIVCVEAWNRKVLVHTTDEVLKSVENMDYWRKTLTLPCFFVPHRSFIINMHFVHSIEKDTIYLKYAGQRKEVFLTRRKYTQFKDTYLMYLESTR